jgi:N-acetyl-anhydromuramyl-L-alanine amidase AmpD
MRIDWAAQVLRDAKLEVVEETGWATSGKDFVQSLVGVILHHDGSGAGQVPAHPTVIIDGRSDLAGPLSQWYLSRRGVWHVVASGRANHAGAGHYNCIQTGNSRLLGVEAANNGTTEAWPEAQMDAYVRGIAAILRRLNAPSLMAIGHKEWAPTRKVDPSFSMRDFRHKTHLAMNEAGPRFPGVEQRRGTAGHGTAPAWIRQQLARWGRTLAAGEQFDVQTEKEVKALQQKLGLKRKDGVVDAETWLWLESIDAASLGTW